MPRSAECRCPVDSDALGYQHTWRWRKEDCPVHGEASLLVPREPPDSTRVLMNVHPQTRERLRALLTEPEMRGAGYSAFINRAVEVAEKQILESRVPPEG